MCSAAVALALHTDSGVVQFHPVFW